jgi:hypothetical protein
MRLMKFVVGSTAVLTLVACTSAAGDAGANSDRASATSVKTEHPKSHEFKVTIRDATVATVYKDSGDNSGNCVSTAPKGFPNLLTVAGPDANGDPVTLKSFKIPATAHSSMGACESNMTVTVPYASRYIIDFGIEGHGVATGDEPKPTWITTEGKSQDVTVIAQVVVSTRVGRR